MILPPRELEHFSHYEENFKSKDVDYRTIGYDEVIVHYSKKTWYGLKRWKKKYEFFRNFSGSEGTQTTWKQDRSCTEFISQLHELSHGQWTQIPTEMYNKFIETYPEYKL